ncbi:PIN domain-containing protein [Arthrobacter burdickii]|uniref:PIN domain-containing protein n=1 Tax=Arthrobacter burdickii TaxID=3035920 RepID=A0ABT8JYZ6_9MICC|nr:PIN domain-containing protein [Arthrobacter burdickii]MDN4610391.1 PIN domain-containing protein [Arthrobacter burdickii]
MPRTSGLLLDTDVVVELRSPRPSPAVVDFLQRRRHFRIFVSALTIGELHLVSRENQQYQYVGAWVQEFVNSYSSNILSVDADIAAVWGPMLSDAEVSAVDSLIAATAISRSLSIVSGNVEIYRKFSVSAINPWIPEAHSTADEAPPLPGSRTGSTTQPV